MVQVADNTNLPWYRHLWVWLVMIPPASAVVAGFITAWLAGGPPALVVDDYSEIAMATEQSRNRDRLAAELGLFASIDLPAASGAAGRLQLRLRAAQDGFVPPPQLQLQIIHPTREELDRRVILDRADDLYTGTVDRPDSRVYLQLEDMDGQWRLVGELPAGETALELYAVSKP